MIPNDAATVLGEPNNNRQESMAVMPGSVGSVPGDATSEEYQNHHPQDHPNMMPVIVGGAVGGAVGAFVTGPMLVAGVNAVGFTAGGIAAGSAAAAMMSAEAIAAGGAVASGGLVATLQSFGAVGAVVGFPGFALSLAGAAVIGAVGACVGGIITSCRSGIGGGIATGLVHGQFTVATEEGCGNVLAYTFRYEEEAWEAFDRMPCCRIIFDGSGKELDHRGANLFAFNTIRNHMQWKSSKLPGGMYSGLIFGKYVIATEEGRYNVKVYGFSSEEEAQEAFNKVPCCCILFNPSGEELDHHGSHDPSFNTIREHVRGRGIGAIGRHNGLLQGQWMVVTEEGTNNVLAYDFSEECEARKFFDDYPCFRILFDAFGNELDHRGATEALNGIRRHVRVACSYKGNIDV